MQRDGERDVRESGFGLMLGRCEEMLTLYDQIERVATTDATVLITGESGTGKELAARAVHDHSRRRGGPYLAVNIAAVPQALVESELFGCVKGSFTGADANRRGRFEAAAGGTLFVDEIGDLELPLQAKLLRVLEDHRITPLGSNDSKHVDVRVVAATNRDLGRLVGEGRFREDLYYRLNVVALSLPPLRSRREDIPLLVEHFFTESCAAHRRPACRPDEHLSRFLQTYRWPGNVRQLRNCVESMVVLARSTTLTLDDLPPMVRTPAAEAGNLLKIPNGWSLDDVERVVVRQTLRRLNGKRQEAAQSLGISVRTLQRKLKQWEAESLA
jgi:DNA-binding NtrC family response regulator